MAHQYNTYALIKYLYKAMFSQTKSALLHTGWKGHTITTSGLTEETINKHLKIAASPAMGHMPQMRPHIRLTTKTESHLI
jgi:hypothetical protein